MNPPTLVFPLIGHPHFGHGFSALYSSTVNQPLFFMLISKLFIKL